MDSAIAFEDAHSHDHGMEVVSRSLQSTAGWPPASWSASRSADRRPGLLLRARPHRRVRAAGHRRTDLLRRAPHGVRRTVPEVSGEPAVRRRTRHHRPTHHAVLPDDRAERARRRGGHPRQTSGAPTRNWNATGAAGAAFLVAVGLAYAFLPAINEVPKDFPATLLWQFRLSAIAIQLTLWTSFGLLFGHLAERLLTPPQPQEPRRRPRPHGPPPPSTDTPSPEPAGRARRVLAVSTALVRGHHLGDHGER